MLRLLFVLAASVLVAAAVFGLDADSVPDTARGSATSASGTAAPSTTWAAVTPDVERRTVAYSDAGDQTSMDVYRPRSLSEPAPTLVLIHGGGWVGGDKESLADLAVDAARRGYVAVSVNYRLAPGAAWPAQQDDVVKAVEELRAQSGDLGIDPDRIAALGSSSGGHLAALLGTLGHGSERVDSVVTWSAPTDLAALVEDVPPSPVMSDRLSTDVVGCTIDECRDRYVDASPVVHAGRGDAPTLSVTASDDDVVPAEQSRALDSALGAAGVEHDLLVLDGDLHGDELAAKTWEQALRWVDYWFDH